MLLCIFLLCMLSVITSSIPEINNNSNIGPDVTKHLVNHCQSSFKRSCEPILVFINYKKRVDFRNFITQNRSKLFHKCSIFCVFKARCIHHSDICTSSKPLSNAECCELSLGHQAMTNFKRRLLPLLL